MAAEGLDNRVATSYMSSPSEQWAYVSSILPHTDRDRVRRSNVEVQMDFPLLLPQSNQVYRASCGNLIFFFLS